VARGGVSARYLPTSEHSGHLLYSNKGTLFAIPFDLDKLETCGTAVAVLDDVQYAANRTDAAHFAFSPSGALVYRKGSPSASAMSTVQWLDAPGKKQLLPNKPGEYLNLRLSRDGKRLAVGVREGSAQDILVYDPQRDPTTKLTFGGGIYSFPVWSPDGRFVVFASIGNGIFWARADGGGAAAAHAKQDGSDSLVIPKRRQAAGLLRTLRRAAADLDGSARPGWRATQGRQSGAVSQEPVLGQ